MTAHLADTFNYWARRRAGAPAVVFPGRTLSWADLDRASDEFAVGFRSSGIGPGDRVGLVLGNCPEFVEVTIAAFKIGAIVVPLNVRWTASEVTTAVDLVAPSLVVADEAHEDRVIDLIGHQRVASTSSKSAAEPLDRFRGDGLAPTPSGPRSVTDPAVICFTSGTTGLPKGAVLSHESVAATGIARVVADGLTHADRYLLPISLTFTGGIVSGFLALTVVGGLSGVITDGFDADAIWDLTREHGITCMSVAHTVLELATKSPNFAAVDLQGLRSVFTGGSPIDVTTVEAFQRKGVAVSQGYAQTESASSGATLQPEWAAKKPGTVGRAELFLELRVADDDDRDVLPGTPGEILMRGPQVMSGYWGNPAASEETLRGGWLHTGDVGSMDDDGFVTILDRRKDMLISGGLNVYSAELERVLSGCPGVMELAAIGVPDLRWGEVPMIIVRSDGEFNLEVLVRLAHEHLADYKRPKYLVSVDEPLPRTPTGKLAKAHLRARWSQALGEAHRLK